ncbi:DUF4105 domain-containing protein [Nemorincola caseinilytica]|uniref:DUF4105 domain-containing protein n=2 Tax=Nemorincola caseinilytica TaxID=2054315 RepID=A0ABP8N9V2_9BACT
MGLAAGAQSPVADTMAAPAHHGSGLRISLLTCGVGDEVYETFGHTAVRITDSNANPPFDDLVYNYGMFNGYDKGFELKFMRGKLKYYVATNYFGTFMEEYYAYGRSVEEQELVLDDDKKLEIKAYLENNALPENRYYKYDFFFDNCATRIRDIFPRTLGSGFVYGDAVRPVQGYTFRDIMNKYFYDRHWTRLGVNILLGSRIDKVLTNMDIMFLPDYLRDGLAAATLNGRPISKKPELILDGSHRAPAGLNVPMIMCCALLVLTILGHSLYRLRVLGRIMNGLLLFVTGLLGCLILLMWFGTDHQGCGNNFNVLWMLPVNILLLVWRPKGIGKYAIIAIGLIGVSLVLHVCRIQGLIPEFLPLMAALVVVYISLYRQGKSKAKANRVLKQEYHDVLS